MLLSCFSIDLRFLFLISLIKFFQKYPRANENYSLEMKFLWYFHLFLLSRNIQAHETTDINMVIVVQIIEDVQNVMLTT